MPVVPLKQLLADATAGSYGIPAINVFNDLTLDGVLAAAVEARSPLIVQTSVKTVKSITSPVLWSMWSSMTAGIEVPVTLHLDHCPDRAVISECLAAGWNSVLFDASHLPVEENLRQTVEVVAEARRYGADVEGEIESITGVEDGIGSDTVAQRQSLDGRAGLPGPYAGRRLRPLDRQRARLLQAGPGARLPAGVRHRGRPPRADRPARRERAERRAVLRPDRPGLRQGQHLDRAQGAVHAVQPEDAGAGAGGRQVGPAVAVRRRTP